MQSGVGARFWLEVHYPSYKPLLSRGSFLEQGGVRANSNGGEAVIRIKFCYYPYYIPSSFESKPPLRTLALESKL